MSFPDHPIIAAMERDGCLRRRGSLFNCCACDADICPGETYYRTDSGIYCIGCSDKALSEYEHTADFPEEDDD